MYKKVIVGIIAGLILIYGIYALINFTKETETHGMSLAVLSYEEAPERVQEGIDEFLALREQQQDSEATGLSMNWGNEEYYEVIIPSQGEQVEILKMGDDEAKGRGKAVVYTLMEKEDEGDNGVEDIVIIEVKNYAPGHFSVIYRGN
jgi:hypothetical protein